MWPRQRQYLRYSSQLMINAHVDGQMLDKAVRCEPKVDEILRKAINHFNLSARGYHRLLRVSRTIADLAGSSDITSNHVLEAINYRKV
jgi:magnesium chelatase family protein